MLFFGNGWGGESDPASHEAILKDGTVVSWGNADLGGDSREVQEELMLGSHDCRGEKGTEKRHTHKVLSQPFQLFTTLPSRPWRILPSGN